MNKERAFLQVRAGQLAVAILLGLIATAPAAEPAAKNKLPALLVTASSPRGFFTNPVSVRLDSPVDGAAANELSGAVPDELREARRARFMQVQEEISRSRLRRKVGSRQRILIDAVSSQGAVGRSTADAPEIDGRVYVAPDPRLKVGEFYDVQVDASDAHDLHAVLV